MKSKKNVGRILSIALLLVFALATFGAEAAATETEVTPRYTGVSTLAASLDISKGGCASCYGYAKVLTGYTADLRVELQQDGDTIKTWTASGTKDIEVVKEYWVASGHDYQVVVSATVRNSSGKIVDTPSITSRMVKY